MPRLNAFTNKIIVGKGLRRNFIFNKIISTNTQNYNIRTDAMAAGWNGVSPLVATITVNSGVIVGSSSTAVAAFDTGVIPTGSEILLTNNGTIVGAGGAGGQAYAFRLTPGQNGAAGGNAVNVRFAVSITNNGTIAGGGGGGGGGGHGNWSDGLTYAGGAGGGGAGNIVGAGSTGITNSSSGTLTNGSNGTAGYIQPAYPGNSGAGTGGSPGVNGTNGGNRTSGGAGSGGGGGGGGLGAAGGSGGTGSGVTNPQFTAGGTGGAAGKVVNLNGFTVTWLATGTRYGAIS